MIAFFTTYVTKYISGSKVTQPQNESEAQTL